jgi:hypothetical protein
MIHILNAARYNYNAFYEKLFDIGYALSFAVLLVPESIWKNKWCNPISPAAKFVRRVQLSIQGGRLHSQAPRINTVTDPTTDDPHPHRGLGPADIDVWLITRARVCSHRRHDSPIQGLKAQRSAKD